jgi:glucose/arabinose dehydrogenase
MYNDNSERAQRNTLMFCLTRMQSPVFRGLFGPLALMVAVAAVSGCGQSPRLNSSETLGGASPAAPATTPGANGSNNTPPTGMTLPDGALDTNTLTPETRLLRASDLPAPLATPSVRNPPNLVAKPRRPKLSVPAGFAVYEWASDLNNPRVLTVAPNGDVFVAESGPNRVIVLRDADGDNKPEVKETFASDGLRQPFGIAFYPPNTPNPTHVYVANTDGVVRFPYKNGDTKATGPAETIVGRSAGRRLQPALDAQRDLQAGWLQMYVSVGSQGNIAEEERSARPFWSTTRTGRAIACSRPACATRLDWPSTRRTARCGPP